MLNSGRHTQPDPQSCRVRSLGGRRGGAQNKQRIKKPKQNWVSRRPIVKTQTQKKASRQQCRSGTSSSPTPCCESLRQQHPNSSNFGKDWQHAGGASLVVLVVQLVSRHSCVADRFPVVVRFPAGLRVRLKTVTRRKATGSDQKKHAGGARNLRSATVFLNPAILLHLHCFLSFFFLWYGRSHSEARSLHVKKQFKITSTLTPVVM